ncbi:hypothetical protein ACWOAH_07920 [Vagococcus vulneris]|uniref:DUF4367 domain-containing protein n=1 Tax=Vagococcus vulneris TaxID=1977869 RepID=A0A429ZWP6_9ENTE|nr:hypothetical protein [Vagococcus vulneris]RST98227.1 hypothetical protein CBF37_08650 [Vagococcus vulneris]
MRKVKKLAIIVFLFLLAGCSAKETSNLAKTSNSESKIMRENKKNNHAALKRQYVVNNMLVGQSKISFNNQEFSHLSDGKFTKSLLWGTFRSDKYPDVYLQINAADKEQPIYGEINGYELEGVNWDKPSAVQYVNVMEEALQFSKDKKSLLYKGRTGDVIFSVSLFGDEKLTDREVLALKKISKSIKVEFVGET